MATVSTPAHFNLVPIRVNADATNRDGEDDPLHVPFDPRRVRGTLLADPRRARAFYATNLDGFDTLFSFASSRVEGANDTPTTAIDTWKANEPFRSMMNIVYYVQCALLAFSGEVLLMRRVPGEGRGGAYSADGDRHVFTRHDPTRQLMPVSCPALVDFSARLALPGNSAGSYQLTPLDERRIWMHPTTPATNPRMIAYILSFGAHPDETRTQRVELVKPPRHAAGIDFQGFAMREGSLCAIYEPRVPATVAPELHYYLLPKPDDTREEITLESAWCVLREAKAKAPLVGGMFFTSQQCGQGSALRVNIELIPAPFAVSMLVVRDQRTVDRPEAAIWPGVDSEGGWANSAAAAVRYAEPGILYALTMDRTMKAVEKVWSAENATRAGNNAGGTVLEMPSRIDRFWLRHIDWRVAREYPGLIPRSFIRFLRALAWLRWRDDGGMSQSGARYIIDPTSAVVGPLWGSLPLELFECVLVEAWRAFLAPMVIEDLRW